MRIFNKGGYLAAWGNLPFGKEVTAAEYANLLDIIANKPTAPDGYDYRLKDTLEWEIYELPEPEPVDDEITDAEALEIIRGGAV